MWYIVKGGPVMIPIILGSIIGFAIIIEKLWALWSTRMDVDAFTGKVFDAVRKGDFDAAIGVCDRHKGHPLARILKEGIERRDLPVHELEKVLERIGNGQVQRLEQYLGGLISVIGIEPLLGFLGTITGLIKAFMSWEKAGPNITVSALAGGIYEAMITTAAGLIVAVPFYLICNYIVSRIKYISFELSDCSMELVEIFSERSRGRVNSPQDRPAPHAVSGERKGAPRP